MVHAGRDRSKRPSTIPIEEALARRPRRPRFTIGSLMIAVAVVAGLLALPIAGAVGLLVLCIPCLALIGAQWFVFRGHRRLAAIAFWGLAILINALYVVSCLAPDYYLLMPLFLGWIVIAGPVIGGVGEAWARLLTRRARRRARGDGDRAYGLRPDRAARVDALDLLAAPYRFPLRQAEPGPPGRSGRRREGREPSARGRCVPGAPCGR